MSSDELARHRKQVSFETEVILQGYWQAEMSPEVKAGVMADWADELQDWTIDQVRWGLRQWRRDNPRRKPNPADVLAILKDQRGKTEIAKLAALPKPAPEVREPISADRANAILSEVGFKVRRIEGAIE